MLYVPTIKIKLYHNTNERKSTVNHMIKFFFGVQIFSQLAHETHETSGVHG